MVVSGIYQIKNIKTNQAYIGSSIDINKRKLRHYRELKNNKHHNIYLQRSYNKYGKQNFMFEIIKKINFPTAILLFAYEQFYIRKSELDLYNIGDVCGGDNLSNHPYKKQIIQKRSKTVKNKSARMTKQERSNKWGKFKEQNPNWKGGKTFFTCPNCHNIIRTTRKNKLCKKCDLSNRFGENNTFYGKKHSEKSKTIISKKMIGKKPINSQKVCIHGIIYNSKSDAAKALNVVTATITNRIKAGWNGYESIQDND